MKKVIVIMGAVLAVVVQCSCGYGNQIANYDLGLLESQEEHADADTGDSAIAEEAVKEEPSEIEVTGTVGYEFQRNPIDYTVDLTDYDVFSEDDISGRKLLQVIETPSDVKYPRPEQISRYSPYILIGTIENICFTDKIGGGDSAHTLCSFRVEQALRGDFVADDQITIEMYGGYIRGEIYDQTLKGNGMVSSGEYVEMAFPGYEPFPQNGTHCVLFLRESNSVEGAYSRIGDYTGEYQIASDGSFFRYLSEGENWVYGAEEDIKAAIYQNPFEGGDSNEPSLGSINKE